MIKKIKITSAALILALFLCAGRCSKDQPENTNNDNAVEETNDEVNNDNNSTDTSINNADTSLNNEDNNKNQEINNTSSSTTNDVNKTEVTKDAKVLTPTNPDNSSNKSSITTKKK